MDSGLVWPIGGAAITASLVAAQLVRRKRRAREGADALARSVAAGRHIPPTLHPVINTDLCIGSLSCLKACPEGDILGVIGGAARLVHADHCIGHGRCAAECPVNAIKLVFGTAERGVDLPEVDQFFESSRAGVHVVGELGGMGLIKNAVRQGLQVSDRLDEVLPPTDKDAETVDVAIVGGGPAGLAAAAALHSKGRTCRVLEQGTLGGTVAQYPRQKVVMTEPMELPYLGRFGKALVSKEELLHGWHKLVQKARIVIEEGVKVTGLEGQDGAFTVLTDKGTVPARKVVLACGRRGTPRKLGVPGEEGAKVAYSLIHAEQYDGCDVLVVGGGDSAIEAASQLAEQSTARVVISYRGDAFAKCRDRNRARIAELEKAGRVKVQLSTQVKRIGSQTVELTHAAGGVIEQPNDFVIVQAGGELPLEFLQRMGVDVRRYHGEALGEHKPTHQERRRRTGSAKEKQETARRRAFHLLYFGAGLIILTWLLGVGGEYYLLPHAERVKSALHPALKPAGSFGHPVGIIATLFMLSNFLYAVRKRARSLTGLGTIRGWLDFHMFVGFMSPLVIAFHAAFQSNNRLASTTALSLIIVVSTGIVGRYIFGLVPTVRGQALELTDLRALVARIQDRTLPLIEEARDRAPLEALLSHAAPDPKAEDRSGSVFGLTFRLLGLPLQGLLLRLRLLRGRWLFADPDDWQEFREALLRLHTLRLQIGFFNALKALMRTWRLFHASLAVLLVVVMTAHIGVSLYLGYGWKYVTFGWKQ